MTNELEAITHFPFYVEIWGTVSDWIMIFVTAFTAIYLVKTFRQQNTALEIEGIDSRCPFVRHFLRN